MSVQCNIPELPPLMCYKLWCVERYIAELKLDYKKNMQKYKANSWNNILSQRLFLQAITRSLITLIYTVLYVSTDFRASFLNLSCTRVKLK